MDVLETSPQLRRLDSWKEIGAFFGRDERTVKRWERERGLPVHRVPGSGRGRVFAYATELEQWLQRTKAAEAEGILDDSDDAAVDLAPIPPQPEFPPRQMETSGALALERQPAARTAKVFELPHRVPVESSSPGHEAVAHAAPSPERHEVAPRPRRAWLAAAAVICLVLVAVAAYAVRAHRKGVELATAHTPDPAAEQLYLKGVYYWQKRTPDSLHAAVDAFTQAIVHDPGYAAAYAGLAECYDLLREFDTMPASEAYPRAKEAAARAIALDPNSAVGHRALAFALFFGEHRTADAEREFQTALKLDPNSSTTHHWYANYLFTIGKMDQALEHIDLAQKLDPSSKAILADKGLLLSMMGRVAEGRSLLEDLEKSDPDFLSPHMYLAGIYLRSRDDIKYLSELREIARLTNDAADKSLYEAVANGYAGKGRAGLLDAFYTNRRAAYDAGKLTPVNMAFVANDTGHKEEIAPLLQAALDGHTAAPETVAAMANKMGVANDPRLSLGRQQALLQQP